MKKLRKIAKGFAELTPLEDTIVGCYCNGAVRESRILAHIGPELLLEIHMPSGFSVLRYVRLKDSNRLTQGDLNMERNMSYPQVPLRFLSRMAVTGIEWACTPVNNYIREGWAGYGNVTKKFIRLFTVKERLDSKTKK